MGIQVNQFYNNAMILEITATQFDNYLDHLFSALDTHYFQSFKKIFLCKSPTPVLYIEIET